jgi:hypothetical protein
MESQKRRMMGCFFIAASAMPEKLAEITSARTLSSHRRPGSPPPELLAEKNKSKVGACK